MILRNVNGELARYRITPAGSLRRAHVPARGDLPPPASDM